MNKRLRLSLGLLSGLLFLLPALSEAAPLHRFALLVGHNRGGQGLAKLRYATSDAAKMKDVLQQMAGYPSSHVWLLTNPSIQRTRRTFSTIRQRIKAIRKKQPNASVLLLVYYSGHAKRGKFLLGGKPLPFRELQTFLRTSGATLRLAILDACETGGMTLQKGLRRRKKGFKVPYLHLAPTAKGEVIITASGERESAHEDPVLRGGIFTHYWVTGLRGAADRDRDGHVTLQEAYRYAYSRTLERTILSVYGPQRARFRKQLAGFGELILSTLRKPKAWLYLRRGLTGRFFIWNVRRDMLLAELKKQKGRSTTIALLPGRYVLQWRRRGGVYAAKIALEKGQRLRLGLVGRNVAYTQHTTRGSAPLSNDASTWRVFQGQMDGPSMDVKYQIGWSGLGQSVLHQGPSLSFLTPLTDILNGRTSLLTRLTYQYGFASNNTNFQYDMHLLHLDLGWMWNVVHRQFWMVSLGLRVRVSPLFQVVPSRSERSGDTLLSFMFGSGLLLNVQYALSQRWFLTADLDGGVRILNLANNWTARWTLAFSLGVGVRF